MNSKTNTYKQNIKGWMVVACGGIFYMYQFMIRVSPNIMNNELLSNFALDAAGLGVLLGAYNWSYSAMQLPLGITIDRWAKVISMYSSNPLRTIMLYFWKYN